MPFLALGNTHQATHTKVICIHCVDLQSFVFKDEKEEEFTFEFDKVFYENSEQGPVYEFLALPIVKEIDLHPLTQIVGSKERGEESP
ncbi:hypothetical protein ACLB2K_029606 [Fragaria x ananassa]